MSSKRVSTQAQRLPNLPVCAHCGVPIPTGVFKPRQFCSDAHRKAAARAASKRTKSEPRVPEPGLTENIERTTESAEIGAKNPNEINGRVNGQTGSSGIPITLLGSEFRWPNARALDPILIEKIYAAEIGVPVATVTSSDGVTSTITPTRTSAAIPARRGEII